jgi:hypothetical protein
MNSFFRELKQRKVYRVALGYAVVAWVVIQISATVMPADGALALSSNVPLALALLRLDPMFGPLRNDPRFQELCRDKQP